MTGLERLDLAHNAIRDVTPLAALTNLRSLDLSDNLVESVAPLAALTNLRSLDLSYNRIESLSPLSSLDGLEELNVLGNRIRSLHGVEGMTSLRALNIAANPVEGLEPLSGLANLEHLVAWSLGIDDIAPLAGLANLRSLDLSDNRIADLIRSPACPTWNASTPSGTGLPARTAGRSTEAGTGRRVTMSTLGGWLRARARRPSSPWAIPSSARGYPRQPGGASLVELQAGPYTVSTIYTGWLSSGKFGLGHVARPHRIFFSSDRHAMAEGLGN